MDGTVLCLGEGGCLMYYAWPGLAVYWVGGGDIMIIIITTILYYIFEVLID